MPATYPIALIAMLQCVVIFATAFFTHGDSLIFLLVPMLWTCAAVFLQRLDKGYFISLLLPYGVGILLLVLMICKCAYFLWSLFAPSEN